MSYGTVKTAQADGTGTSSGSAAASSPTGAEASAPPAENVADENRMQPWKGSIKAFYDKNFGLLLVFLAQIFASSMNMTTRLLETSFEEKFHALQVIFVRMGFTMMFCILYMWYKQIPGFPFGSREVRGLLILRGVAGSSGLFGLYYSLSYLDISDATVVTFLVPTLTSFICWVALREPFTVKEASAGLVSFVGVLFIARPTYLFPSHDADNSPEDIKPFGILPPVAATPAERSVAVLFAIAGCFAAATAYTTIRVIGKRAHSLISVNYFAMIATFMSFFIILIHPDLSFKVPKSTAQWLLIVSIGISGFMLQFLLTEGLQREKAGRATNLIYTQIIFSLIIERVVWGTLPPAASLIGSLLIIGAAVWVSLQKRNDSNEASKPMNDEERRLLSSE
ncbi:hypothetical protein S7711_02329, partial [Stachybotrys chartarum IBT 7711]